MDQSYNKKAYIKLSQFKKSLENKSDINIIEKLLEKEGHINYSIPADSPFGVSIQDLTGYTALHLAIDNNDLFLYLLCLGADFTKTNKAGKTPLHMLVEEHKNMKEPLDKILVNSVLSAHVATNNYANPCNNDGLSHFHIACMTKNANVVQFFLNNDISVDEAVSINSKFSPGYSPLHFAAMCTNIKVAKILLANGANIHITDGSEKSPLHVLIEDRMQMFDSMADVLGRDDAQKNLQVQIQNNDKFISMLLENMSSDNECLDNIGLSNFHVACILQDLSVAERLADQVVDLNHCVYENSNLWPGYTALHFAAHHSIDRVKMLMNKGANVEAKDAKGLTPLDICIERYNIDDIRSIISLSANWNGVLFSDGATTLVSFVSNLVHNITFRNFVKSSVKDINMCIPMESPLWPGYSPLHLAVLFAERPKLLNRNQKGQKEMLDTIIRFCLSQGADLSLQDSRGRTPFHLAFRLGKMSVVSVLFNASRQIPNVLDEDNLSHLHIVCAAINRRAKLKKCIMNDSALNTAYKGSLPINLVNPGATPLHVSLVESRCDAYISHTINTLLEHGADPSIEDAYGLTPIHWLMNFNSSYTFCSLAMELLKVARNDCVVKEYGLSYLHIACRTNYHTVVKRCLNSGTDVNLTINYTRRQDNDPLSFLSNYDQQTPLHMITWGFSTGLEKLLIRRGANVFAEKADGVAPISTKIIADHFISRALSDFALQNRARKEYGWTKLHLSCLLEKNQRFDLLVRAESKDINAQIFSNSPIWKGCTPLHILMHPSRYLQLREQTYFIRILLEYGADVTIFNDEQDTPLTISMKSSLLVCYDEYHKQVNLLMKYHKNFAVNPVNAQGISHFHVACHLNALDAVAKFLSHGVDVNQPIDFFSNWYAGYTPLHLASNSMVIELLIRCGGNIHAENANGYSVLHNILKEHSFDENAVAKIIESGADINKPNFRGETPFECATDSRMESENLHFFIRRGFIVNSCNPITGVGYIAMLLNNSDVTDSRNIIVELIMREKSTNIFGRTTLHHLVTKSTFTCTTDDYVFFIEKLIKAGHDIDEQDSEGRTALHLTVKYQNHQALRSLLECGADVNVLDNDYYSVLSYSELISRFYGPDYTTDILRTHAFRLILLNLYLNQIDVASVIRFNHVYSYEFTIQTALSKEICIGVRLIRLYDFLSETGVISTYPRLNLLERSQLDKYFEDLGNDNSVKEITSFLKLQYRKALKRRNLLSLAIYSLRRLLGFDLPDLCAENIFLFLSNSDLKNIIRAENIIELEDLIMDVD